MKKLTTSQKNKLISDGFTLVEDSLTLGQFKERTEGGWVDVVLENGTHTMAASEFKPNMLANLIAYQLVGNPNQSNYTSGEDGIDEEILEHPLYPIFIAAIQQAINGKGERHGGGRTPFMEQSWLHLANKHGNGFLTGQSCKKCEEAAETRTGEAFDTEVLGAINYAGMAIIHRRMIEDGGEE